MLKVDFYEIVKHDYDNLIVLCGKEGKGKSTLGLWAIEIWLKMILKLPNYEQKFKTSMGVKPIEWATLLEEISEKGIRGYINNFDEAGDVISGKHSSQKFVTSIEDAWKVIRGLNLETIITTPSIFILSPYIRNHRIRTCWYVEKRGICHVFYGNRLTELISLNENKEQKNMLAVEPNFSFKFPKYTGVFLKEYLAMKNSKMNQVLAGLKNAAVEHNNK
jgi:hypothetical protein